MTQKKIPIWGANEWTSSMFNWCWWVICLVTFAYILFVFTDINSI
mgnify:CR=1 FL=1